MRRKLRFGRWCSLVLLAGLFAAGMNPAGVAQAHGVSESQAASQKSSQSNVALNRMLLLLAPSAAQQKSLDALLAAQTTPGNASYHQWLTPAQYAACFAVSEADAAQVVGWLKAQGFQVAALPASRGWIEFSGTAEQVQTAFGAPVKSFAVDSGAVRYALAGQAQLPAAISGSVAGLVSLDGVLSAPAITAPVELNGTAEALAAQTSLAQTQSFTPVLARKWLNLPANSTESATGAGESVAILARSNVRPEDFAAFRKSFGLSEQTLSVTPAGSDPGRNNEEAAAIQAASWAGVAAPGAQIVLVPAASTGATDGIDLALAAVVDGALTHTVVVGYTSCESGMSPAHSAFYAALYRQAAAQGMAIVAATGDSGAAACHAAGTAQPVSTGYAVNALASTPWNTAVGAVAFTPGADSAESKSLSGWQPAEATAAAYATGGGASQLYPTPQWQSAAGLPASDPGTQAAHHRYLPDLSLPTAADDVTSHGLAFCYSGDMAASGCRLVTSGGSASAAALFSGIAALLAQKYGPQGNLAPNLYALAQRTTSATAFADVTAGNARLHCSAGSPNCDESNEIGFSAATGYDLASGLGSIHADLLLKDWATPQATGTSPATAEMTNVGGITYNPSAIVTLSAKVLSGSGGTVPTGTVQFYDQTTGGNTGTPVTLTATGTASYQEQAQFTNGGHNIEAQYSGDATYEAAVSQPVTINIQPSPTSLVVAPSTTTPAGGATITVTGTVTSSNPGATPPSGTLTVNLDGIAQGNATLSTTANVTTGSVSVTVPTGGSHTVQGTYSGDTNYYNSTSQSVTITVAKVASVTTIAATPSTLTTGVPETLTATVAPASAAAGVTYALTGTVSFYDTGTTLLGTAAVASNTAILTGITLAATSTHTITAVYSGDTTYTASTSSPLVLASTLFPVTVTLSESNTVIAPGQPVTLSATVTPVNTPPTTAEQHPSGYLLFYANNGTTNTLISGQIPVVESTGYSSVGSVVVPHLAAGVYVVTAQYFGDPTYGPGISNSLNLDAEDFSLTCYQQLSGGATTTNLSVKQGATVTASCVVASLGGLTGTIQLACAEQNPAQVGAISCTFPPPSTVASNGTLTLTIATTAGDISLNRNDRLPNGKHGSPPWATAGGGVALAFAGLLLSPIGRRARWLKPGLRSGAGKMLVLVLLLAGLASAGMGCSSTSGGPTLNSGTPLGVHTLKITAGADVGTVTVTHNAYLTVDVTP